jgi:hypothetical protein
VSLGNPSEEVKKNRRTDTEAIGEAVKINEEIQEWNR